MKTAKLKPEKDPKPEKPKLSGERGKSLAAANERKPQADEPQRSPARKRPAKLEKRLDSFFRKGRYFKCRFTGEDIGKFQGQRLIPSSNYAQVMAVLSSGQGYRFTCSKSYVPSLTLLDVQEAFDADPATPNKSGLKVLSFEVIPEVLG